MARIERSVEVNASPEAVYERLLHFEEYPSFMQDVRGVRRIGALGLQWETGHGERSRSWEAEITQQIPGRSLAWRHMHGPRYEAAIGLAPLGTGEAGAAVTRVTLAVECEPAEQVPAVPDDPQHALQERIERDLARLKKHVERNDPSGIHVVSAAASGGHPTTGASDAGEAVGKTIGQTAAERSEWRASAAPQEADRPHDRPWRRAPTLPEIWDLWQQPLRMARRVSHNVERVIDTVRGQSSGGAATGSGTAEPGAGGTPGGSWTPAVETQQHEREFIVSAELPGMKCEDVQVEIKHDRLTIAGERRPQSGRVLREDRYSERRYGRFYRAITLPPGAQPDQAEAAMHDGVLEIKVPLAEYADRPRRLAVRPT